MASLSSAPKVEADLDVGNACEGQIRRAHDRLWSVFKSSGVGVYFVHVMKLYSEVLSAKRYDFGCNFWDREGRKKSYPQSIPFSVSVLAVASRNPDSEILCLRILSWWVGRKIV